jgi:hypothetical protein
MFNANDNDDKLFDKEKQEIKSSKNSKDLYDFSDFSPDETDVVSETKPIVSNPKEGITFDEFEEIFLTDEEMSKAKEKSASKERIKQTRGVEKEVKVDKSEQEKQKKPKKAKRRKRKEKTIEDFEDAKKRRLYKYKRTKFRKVEDFIDFLNENYLDLDEIAEKILTDENFHGWLKKRSKRFDESIDEFKDIVEIIGN